MSDILFKLPEEVTGYALDELESWWSVIQPEATTNLITNPSFEDGVSAATGYTLGLGWGVSAVVSEDGKASGGIHSLKLTSFTGSSETVDWPFTAAASTPYTYSLDIFGVAGETYILQIKDSGSATIYAQKSITFEFTEWQRHHLSYREVAGGSRLARFVGDSLTQGVTTYLDQWQLEAKAYPTTYVDGDVIDITRQRFRAAPAYYWNGQRNASTSSRTIHTNSGGRVISFGDYGFRTTSVVGLGMPGVEVDAYDLGFGGQVYQGVSVKSNEFTITGVLFGKTLQKLNENRKGILQLLRPNKTRDRQQIVLLHQWRLPGGTPFGNTQRIVCAYSEGLQGNITNYYQESIALKFYAVSPYPQEVFGNTAELGYQNTWTNVGVFERDNSGTWDTVGTGASTGSFVYAVQYQNDTTLWAAGAFSQLAGTSAHRIAYWDGSSWNEPGDGFNNTVNDLAAGPSSSFVAAVGDFTTDGLGAGTYRRAALWDGSTWSEMGSGVGLGLNGSCRAVAAHHSGDFYLAGDFTADGTGSSNIYRVARYYAVGDTIVGLDVAGAAGLNASVYCIAVGPDGNVYFGGDFTDVQGAASNTYLRVVKYNVSSDSFSALGDGFNDIVHKLAFSPDGVLYAVGDFTQDGTATYTLRRFARWNGTSWEEVSSELTSGSVGELLFDNNGVAYIASTTIGTLFPGNVPFTTYAARWANSAWIPSDIIVASAQMPRDFAISPSGKIAIGTSVASTTITGAQATTVSYDGTADANPIIQIIGPGTVGQIVNNTTGSAIYFNNKLTLAINETMYVEMGHKLKIYTNSRSNLLNQVIIGPSNLSDFRLAPGDNDIAILVDDEDITTEAWARFNVTNWGLD